MDSLRVPNLAVINRNWYVWTPAQRWYYSPDRVGLPEYQRMVMTDETVASGIEFVVLAALARMGQYAHPDTEIQAFVLDAFARMRGTLHGAVQEILSALWAGFSVTEILWRAEEGAITLDGLATLHPATVMFELEQGGPRSGQLARVLQFPMTAQEVEIPREKAIVFSHHGSFGNAYGTSRLKPAYKAWFYKDKLLEYWGLTLERYGVPLAKASVQNPEAVVVTGDGQTMRHAEYVGRTLEQMRAGSALVFDDQTQVELVQVGRALGGDFQAAIEYHNKMIYRALLLPSLVADNGTVGSYSLGQQHFDMFALTLDALLRDLSDVLIEQLVRRLVDYNFGPQGVYGSFPSQPFVAEDQKALADTFLALTNAGYISPNQKDDLNAVRDRFGFGEHEVQEPSLPSIMPQPQEPTTDAPVQATAAPSFSAMRDSLLRDMERRMRQE